MSSYEGLCPDCRQIECDEACMKAASNVELLPLPEPAMLHVNEPRELFTAKQMQDYARANLAHATAAKDAEIEALRAEVERLQKIVRPKREEDCLTLDHWRMRAYDLEANWSRCSRACAYERTKRIEAEARAEQLAEALRGLVAGAEAEMDPAWECNSYHPALNKGMKLAQAALHPTAAQEGE